MATEAAKYVSVITIIPPGPASFVQILKADPRRWYIRFGSNDGGANNAVLLPGPLPTNADPTTKSQMPVEVKFRDSPSLCTGEWYLRNDIGTTITIYECIYVGD
jgi:hypothetical protein